MFLLHFKDSIIGMVLSEAGLGDLLRAVLPLAWLGDLVMSSKLVRRVNDWRLIGSVRYFDAFSAEVLVVRLDTHGTLGVVGRLSVDACPS